MKLVDFEKKLKKQQSDFLLKNILKKKRKSSGASLVVFLLALTLILGVQALKEKYVYPSWHKTNAVISNVHTLEKYDYLFRPREYYSYTATYTIHEQTISRVRTFRGTTSLKDGDVFPIIINPKNIYEFRRDRTFFYALTIGFCVAFFITLIISYIYFTDNIRLKNAAELSHSFKETKPNIQQHFLIAGLSSLILTAPLYTSGISVFITAFSFSWVMLATGAIIVCNHSWEKKAFYPRFYFYRGMALGVIFGIALFIFSSIFNKTAPGISNEGIKHVAVAALLSGWIIAPFYMLLFWAFFLNKHTKWKIINSLLFIALIVAPIWYMNFFSSSS